MPGGWQGSNRRAELPPHWASQIRPAVLHRDGYQCTALLDDGTRCPNAATDVDHLGDKNDHRLQMLAAKCDWHHKRRSSAQGNAARTRYSTRRPTEKHPGLR